MKHWTTAAALAFAASLSAAPAFAAVETYASYTLTNNFDQAITNLVVYQSNGEGGGSLTWGGFAPNLDGQSSATYTNPFKIDGPFVGALWFGLVQGLPGDASPDEYHVVLGINPQAAAYSENIAWGTLFPNTLEEQLIDHILLTTSGRPFEEIDPGTTGLFTFADGDATTTNHLNGGLNYSTLFAPSSSFTLVAWSSGTVIGSGEAFLESRTVPDAIPEPGTWALMILGFGAAGSALRRRRALAA